MSHRLDPLLRPRSIAVLGASERRGSVGRRTVENLLQGGFGGDLFAVNPGYDTVLGVPCVATLGQLPRTAEHVIFAIGDHRVEAALDEVITHGAAAVTLMSQLVLAEDTEPPLLQRLAKRIRDSGLLACGGNAMGFYNFTDRVWACGFDTRANHRTDGRVTLISQSGAGMSGIVDCEERIDFNLAATTGQEISVAMHDYMDFAIEALNTRVIGLFMETVRNPEGMVAVLEKARRRSIPVVAIKVGRNPVSADLVKSHSGAMAGEDSAFEALFDRYGVQRVSDMDELATALILFAQPHPIGAGGLVSIHDSGGERQLLIDLADDMDVPLAQLSGGTKAALGQRLDPGLPAINPLDAWGAGGAKADRVMQHCLAAMMVDPACAVGAVVHDRAPLSRIYPEYFEYLRAGHAASGKPAFLVANRQGSGSDPRAVEVTREGFPVLDGLRPFLAGVRALFAYRDFLARPRDMLREVDRTVLARARVLIRGNQALDEAEALQLMGAFGLPVNTGSLAGSEQEAVRAAARLGYPVVVKTAQAGIQHKAARQGVHLNLADAHAVAAAWRDLAGRLGERVLVAPMVKPGGLELALGMVRDQQFGPLVMIGFGGTRLEALDDVVFAMPPFGEAGARRQLERLHHRALLTAERDGAQPDLDAFCRAAALFSSVVAALGDDIRELDLNPVVVFAEGCMAVDALLLGTGQYNEHRQSRSTS